MQYTTQESIYRNSIQLIAPLYSRLGLNHLNTKSWILIQKRYTTKLKYTYISWKEYPPVKCVDEFQEKNLYAPSSS